MSPETSEETVVIWDSLRLASELTIMKERGLSFLEAFWRLFTIEFVWFGMYLTLRICLLTSLGRDA
jgi:hypothetical protein